MAAAPVFDAKTWLETKGFDPNRDLESQRASDIRTFGRESSALHVACFSRELRVVQWIVENGASSLVRLLDAFGRTPLWVACRKGSLPIAQYLFTVGASQDISTCTNLGCSPTWIASLKGHLHVLKWLHQNGASDDVMCRNNGGLFNSKTPLRNACEGPIFHHKYAAVACWLIEAGGARNIYYDYVDAVGLTRDVGDSSIQLKLWNHMSPILLESKTFTSLVLPAVFHGAPLESVEHSGPVYGPLPAAATASGEWAESNDLKPPTQEENCERHKQNIPLGLLRGHEQTLLVTIADFLGLKRGRGLRYLREAHYILGLQVCRSS